MSSDPNPDASACPHLDYGQRGYEPADVPATGEGADGEAGAVWDALYAVEDPEMPVSVVDLGLVYGVIVADDRAEVDLTLTYTGCPARRMLIDEVETAAASPSGIDEATVRLVWSPPWSVDLMTDRGKAQLREFGLSV